jgi:hypothetical protein
MIIDKGVPVPGPVYQKPGRFKALAAQMEPDDSVLCGTRQERDSLRKALEAIGCSALTRKVDGGYRVWRIG